MGFNDCLADMISIIKVGIITRVHTVVVRRSLQNLSVLSILYKKGAISNFNAKGRNIVITLKYCNNFSVIKDIVLVSKKSGRSYISWRNLELINNFKGYSGFFILSTAYGYKASTDVLLLAEKSFSGEVLLRVDL